MDEVIYVGIQGHSEFTIGGVLKNWSITDRLKNISSSVAVICLAGQFDTMSIDCHQLILDNLSNDGGAIRNLVQIQNAAHCKFLDEPETCCKEIQQFLVD